MRIQEAIKSGKPCRNSSLTLGEWYLFVQPEMTGLYFHPVGNPNVHIAVSLDEIMANDWELKPE